MNPTEQRRPRYRFGEFMISPSRRQLVRAGEEIPLIPRYFDLLVLLIERRNEAVHRREILDVVWNDVVVSDGALSQAVRILRRTLGDDPREPCFIRTVARHGYRFVFSEVLEESDAAPLALSRLVTLPSPPGGAGSAPPRDPFEAAFSVLLDPGTPNGDEDERREAAERLHALGTAEALGRLDRRPGHEAVRALLRDTRWDLPVAGPVPILGHPGALRTLRILFGLRLRRIIRLAGRRWAAGVAGGAAAGVVAGLLGGLVLRFGPSSAATGSVLAALPLVGLVIGGLAAAGVGAGLATAEALIRSLRGVALVLFGGLGGGAVGGAAHLLGTWTLEGLFGRDLQPVGGGLEGLVLGAAVGLGYALSTPRATGGMATPQGAARILAALSAGLACAAAAAILAAVGRHLGAMSLDFMAQSFPGSQVGLGPLARLLGESQPGPVTWIAISAFEGFMFASGLVLGLTHRPR